MKGQSIQEFMDDIMGPRLVEKEFFYKGEEFMFAHKLIGEVEVCVGCDIGL